MLPLPTRHISAKEVLRFRDDAFYKYFENPCYLDLVENMFGKKVLADIKNMTKYRLKRRILGD
jgi:hypothetical protein